jgi:hypothetical protein
VFSLQKELNFYVLFRQNVRFNVQAVNSLAAGQEIARILQNCHVHISCVTISSTAVQQWLVRTFTVADGTRKFISEFRKTGQ